MITQQKFKQYIEDYKYRAQQDDKIGALLEELCGTWVFFNCENKVHSNFLDLLAKSMGDENDLIDWWIFEDVEKYIYSQDDKCYWDLTTIDNLWLYLNNKLKSKKMTKEMKKVKK